MVISFTKVNLAYGWLGNMAPTPVVHNNIDYRTTEALFQALRFEKNPDIARAIREQKSPMAAKMVAKKYAPLLVNSGYEVMGAQDVDNMRLCLSLKLAQHPNFQTELLATGDNRIIEDCTSRPRGSGLFWGAALQNNQWVGQNMLGQLWEEQRAALQLKNTDAIKLKI